MPIFSAHHRTYSWPPSWQTIPSKESSPSNSIADIDEDPFSHFISPITEEDDPYDDLAFSAGILVPESRLETKKAKFRNSVSRKWARYVARNHQDLHELYHQDEQPIPHHLRHSRPASPPSQDVVPSLIVDEPTRGRAQVILADRHLRRHGRRTSRTLSGHRHSWREPSVDLFTVMEEGESGELPQRQQLQPPVHIVDSDDDDEEKELPIEMVLKRHGIMGITTLKDFVDETDSLRSTRSLRGSSRDKGISLGYVRRARL